MTTGADLARARNRGRYTQQGLADLVGVSRRTVAEWEASPELTPATLAKVSGVLGDLRPGAGPSLTGCSDLELATELVRRLARKDPR